MAQININEISKDYAYSAGSGAFSTVAIPMTASWGPAFEDPASLGITAEEELERVGFLHFPATQQGLEAFTSTYRGPAANYRSAKDYSYQVAVTLLTSGYDIDVCRVCAGTHASGTLTATIGEHDPAVTGTVILQAKYPGTFGNNLIGSIIKGNGNDYWSLITYITDATGGKTAVENLAFVFDINNSNDSIPHISEITPAFFNVTTTIEQDTGVVFSTTQVSLANGSDRKADGTVAAMMADAIALATTRFEMELGTDATTYVAALTALSTAGVSVAKASAIRYMEWNYNATMYVLTLLNDTLAYNSRRLIMPGWDDQNFLFLTGETVPRMASLSPLHARMMTVASASRCATACLDLPVSLERSGVYNVSTDTAVEGYAQKVGRFLPTSGGSSSDGLFATHSALFGPWCEFKYAGTSRSQTAPPAFLALLIQISQIRKQSLQYDWIQPDTKTHGLAIGSPTYKVPKKVLDVWQGKEGVGINVLTKIPDVGMTVWGNSTAYEVPVATYQALANLSTRYVYTALRDVVFRAGIAITFQYNNQEAYSRFYTACSPLLDTMVVAKAITKYEISMSKDINASDSVNLNAVVGVISIWVEGVINSIDVDLVALPAVQ